MTESNEMVLATMEPDPNWEVSQFSDAVDTLAAWADVVTIKVWGDDGCGDCQEQLPGFAAALVASGIDPASVEHYSVERLPEGKKRGPLVDAYNIERIPTVVIERDGEEIARFVEEERVPIAVFLANQLDELEATV